MRSAIASITLFATVIHFTLGCCLHPAHLGGAETCCGGMQSSPQDACCTCHDHDAPQTAAAGAEFHADADRGGLVAANAAHDCDGCGCTATKPEAARFPHSSPAATWRCLPLGTQAAIGPAGGAQLAARVPIPSALRPPLHERFLV